MAKVIFHVDSGANIHSGVKEKLDTVTDLGLAEGEWESMCESDQEKIYLEWMWNKIDGGWYGEDE